MAGLLAAHMLRRHQPSIIEQQHSLPNNHHALLRFRTDAVMRATGIPFREVEAQKAVWYERAAHARATFAMQNLYSQKVTGRITSRSILNLDGGRRYIAPNDFIAQLSHGANIEYGTAFDWEQQQPAPIISTIPMPALMRAKQWDADQINFPHQPIFTITCDLPEHVDVYQTFYYPEERYGALYRASITGRVLQLEFAGTAPAPGFMDMIVQEVVGHFGIRVALMAYRVSEQTYGKLAPIADTIRKTFILAMSDQHQIYSLGRFATWRQILLDDVVQDIRTIESFITERSSRYDYLKKGAL